MCVLVVFNKMFMYLCPVTWIPFVLFVGNMMRLRQAPQMHWKWYLAVFFICPVVYITILFSMIYRLFVYIILKIRHGSKFGGFIKGLDAIQMMSKPSDRIINCLLVFRSNERLSSETLYEKIREVIQKMQKFTKFNSKFKTFMGYSYMVKGQLTVDHCIREMRNLGYDDYRLTKSELNSLMNEYFNAQPPRNNTVPWEMIVGHQEIDTDEWEHEESGDHFYYPVLFRCESALADGITLFQVLIEVLSDEKEEPVVKLFENSRDQVGCFHALYRQLDMFFLLPSFLICNYVLKRDDWMVWKTQSTNQRVFTNENKVYTFNVDDFRTTGPKIKKILKAYKGYHFADVFLSLVSGTIGRFLKTQEPGIPKQYLSTTVPMVPGSSLFLDMNPRQVDTTKLTIENRFIPCLLNLPIYIETETKELEEGYIVAAFNNRISEVNKRRNFLRNLAEHRMWNFYTNIAGTYLPKCLLKYMSNKLRSKIIINYIPGPKKINCWEDKCLSEIVAFTPNTLGAGLTYTIVCYDERVFIGVCITKELMEGEAEDTVQQKLASNLLEFIAEMCTNLELVGLPQL